MTNMVRVIANVKLGHTQIVPRSSHYPKVMRDSAVTDALLSALRASFGAMERGR